MKYIVPLIVFTIYVLSCTGRMAYIKKGEIPESRWQESVGWEDPILKQQVEIVDIIEKDIDGILKLQIKIRNKTFHEIPLEMKVKFFNKDGFQLPERWGWKPIILEPQEIEYLTVTAPEEGAVGYKIILRRPKK